MCERERGWEHNRGQGWWESAFPMACKPLLIIFILSSADFEQRLLHLPLKESRNEASDFSS